MHEVSLVRSLLQSIAREASAHGAASVHRVTVRIEPLAGVDRELFTSAFEVCRRGTVAAGAELLIVGDEGRSDCPSCNAPIPHGAFAVCPACGFPVGLRGGDALVLERLELEVSDHV